MKVKICCFIGHRKIDVTVELKQAIYNYVESLVVNENVKIFLFGSRSQFDDLCYEVVSELKEKYPDIKRVYVRSNYEIISDFYKNYLLSSFEDTFYPKECKNSGKISYLKRNQTMIDQSDYCLFYYNENYLPPKRKWARRDLFEYQPKSGTALAYKYTQQKKKMTYNLFKNTWLFHVFYLQLFCKYVN